MKFIKKKIVLSLVGCGVATALLLAPVRAELQLPNAQDRRPNLSLDPFERAREAIKRLPSSPSTPSSAPTTRQEVAPPPAPEPASAEAAADTKPAEDAGGEEGPKPFSQEFILTSDYFQLMSGGDLAETPEEVPPNSAFFAMGEYTAEVSTNALNLWDDGLFFVHAFGFFGNTSSAILGDFQGLSGNDTGAPEKQVFRLWEAWYEHNFPYNKSSVLLGVHDFNSEFYVLEYATLFLNGSFGTGSEISASAFPSTYPFTTLGFRFKTALRENAYFQFGVYDGTAGDLSKVYDVALGKDDGAFMIGEIGFFNGEVGADGYYKVALGGWYLRKNLEYFTGGSEPPADAADLPEQFAEHPVPGTNGVYLLAETAIGDNLGVFLEAGWADPLYNQYSVFVGAGLNYTGFIPGRADDVLGIGVVQSRQSANYLESLNADPPPKTSETTFELTYSARVLDWLTVQPDVQYVQGVAMDPNISDAIILGVRIQAVY